MFITILMVITLIALDISISGTDIISTDLGMFSIYYLIIIIA